MISEFYDKTMAVTRYSEASDDAGALDYSSGNWVSVFSDKKCMLRPLSASQKVARGKTITDKLFLITCDYMDIRTGDKITIDGQAYDVINPKNPNSKNHHLEIEVEYVS